MTRFYLLALFFGVVLGTAEGVRADDLAVGQKAPGFTLRGVDGATYALADHVGRRGFVLAWFPKAFTPG